jgi:hypothetical protein
MPEICFITTCMGRLAHLQQSLGAAAAQPDSSCVVVDYSCPERCGEWVEQHYPQVKVVRVPDQKNFNVSRARNLGAAEANAPWLCFFDADVILSPQFSERMVPLLQTGSFYLVDPWTKELCGTVICPRLDFQHVGGYDEVLQNWGAEDVELYDRLVRRGLSRKNITPALVQAVLHEDQLRVQHYAIKSPEVSCAIGTLYRIAKGDLTRLLERDLAIEERRNLYEEAAKTVQLWLQTQQETQWRIAYRPPQALYNQEITPTLVYTLNPLVQS